MKIKFIKQVNQRNYDKNANLTLNDFISYLRKQDIQEGIDIKYINNLMVIKWK